MSDELSDEARAGADEAASSSEPIRPERKALDLGTLGGSEAELALLDSLARGQAHEFLRGGARSISADFLRALVMGENVANWPVKLSRVSITNALITGILDVEHVRQRVDRDAPLLQLELVDCDFGETPLLSWSEFAGLSLMGCRLPGLVANGVRVRGDLWLSNLMACRPRDAGEGPVKWPERRELTPPPVWHRIHLNDARVEGDVIVNKTRCGSLQMRKLRCEANVLAHLLRTYEVDLTGAQIGMTLDLGGSLAGVILLSGSRVAQRAVFAGVRVFFFVNAEEARISGGLGFNSSRVRGIVHLRSIVVDGHIDLSGAELGTPGRTGACALSINGARIDSLFLRYEEGRPFVCFGWIDAIAAQLVGDVEAKGLRVHTTKEHALVLNRCEIASLFIRPWEPGDPGYLEGPEKLAETCLVGGVSLAGGRIRNQVVIRDVRLSAPQDRPNSNGDSGDLSLRLDRAEIAGLLHVEGLAGGEGAVSAVGCSARQLKTDLESWPGDGRTMLDGFTYQTIEFCGASRRSLIWQSLAWMDRQFMSGRRGDFWPQPYEALSRALRAGGHGRAADQVAIAKRRRRRNQDAESPFAQMVSLIMDVTSQHGYAPGQAALWVLALTVVGALMIGLGLERGLIAFVPVEIDSLGAAPATLYVVGLPPGWLGQLPSWADGLGRLSQWTLARAPHGCPGLVAPLYALDMIVPLMDLGQESVCRLETRGLIGGWVQAARGAYQILGAIMTAILITTLTGVLRRD